MPSALRPLALILGIVVLGVTLPACAIGNLGGGSGTTSTTNAPNGVPAPSNCATTPTATAHSWVDTSRQIVGSLNGGPVGQISNFVYPLGLPNQNTFSPDSPGFTTWAPDGRHVATLIEVTGAQSVFSYPYIVDTTTKVATRVQLPANMQLKSPTEMEWARERGIAWADNKDLLIFGAMPVPLEIGGTDASQTSSYRYDLSSGTLTPLPGVTSALQGVVRCDTLYYLELSQMKQFQFCFNFGNGDHYWYVGGAYLRRYDLNTQLQMGQPYLLGNTSSCPDYFDGAANAMGWDVSADGAALVYQHTFDLPGSSTITPPSDTTNVQTNSTFLVVDPSAPATPTQILTGAKSVANAYLTISPDQKTVAVVATDTVHVSDPSNAPVYTGSISGGGATPHTPSAGGLPAWYADSSGFDTSGLWSEIPSTSPFSLEQWRLSMPQASATIADERYPASLP